MKNQKRRIKPQGVLKPTLIGTTHIPKTLREELGNPKEIPYVADAHTVIMFDPSKTPEEILESLDVLRRDINLRIEETKKK